jgi:hypothetical protein
MMASQNGTRLHPIRHKSGAQINDIEEMNFGTNCQTIAKSVLAYSIINNFWEPNSKFGG